MQPVHLLQCSLLSLWASSLQDHPSLYWPLRFVVWGEPFFWLNKDFLVDTLTWPVVFGEGLQRQLLGSPLSPVDPDVATHSQELDSSKVCSVLFSVTSSHILWTLATQLGPHLGLSPHHSLTAPFPVFLLSVPCHICPVPSQTLISLVSLLTETKLFSVDARVSAALAPPLGGLQPPFLGYDRPQGSGSGAYSTPLPKAALREEAESPSWGITGYLGVGHTYLYLPGGRTVEHPHKESFVVGMEKLCGVGFPLNGGHPGREDRSTLRLLTATNLCFAERNVYTSEVLAVVMQQLMEQSPLPMLLMRTVIQSLTMYPRLGGFVMNILARLIMKQVTCPGPRPQWGKSQLPGEQDPVSGSPTLPLVVFP